MNGANPLALHAVGGLLMCGRLSHGYSLGMTENNFKARFYGMVMTLFAIISLTLTTLYVSLAS